MSGLAPDLTRNQTQANQAFILGVPNPPDMSQIDPEILKAASPTSLSLLTTRTDKSLSEASARNCRTEYQGIGGLRKLQVVQQDNTAYEAGCGWFYNHPEGVTNPIINRGVFGTMKGPVLGNLGEQDEAKNGTTFTMDLDKAERTISATVAQRLGQSCQRLANLTDTNKQYFGYCKTTNRVIPIETSDSGVKARYPKDMQLKCTPDNIIPARSAPDACPTIQGFIGGRGKGTSQSEGFQSGLAACQLPLTKSCVMQFARDAGCTDNGSLLQALQANTSGDTYDAGLKSQEAYKYYTAKGNLTPALLRDGSIAARQVAIQEFNRLATQAMDTPSEANKGAAAAARDLCIQKDYFLENYDFCSEITPETRINSENITCAQKIWRQQGGDSRGVLYPNLESWSGKTFTQLNTAIESLKKNLTSENKSTQANAIRNFIGAESYKQIGNEEILPRHPSLVGTEVVWIYYENWQTDGAIPIIMRCDTLLQQNVGTKILPEISNNLVTKYQMPSNEGVAIMSAFEIRPDQDQTVNFSIFTDDGVAIGINQMPGQGLNNNNDFNAFNYQAPNWRRSGNYTISANKPNMIGLKWFQGPGAANFLLEINGKTITDSPENIKDIYLTQEPLAPWLQFEICSRPNSGRPATVGFFEKRWNGPCAFPWQFATKWTLQDQQPVPSFDCESSQVSFTTDAKLVRDLPTRGYMSFTTNSWWRTRATFSYCSMKTLALLVRPRAVLNAGSMASVMWWPAYYRGWSSIGMETPGLWVYSPDGRTTQFDFWIGNRGHSYMDCKVNDWNLVVIQITGEPSRGVQKFSCAADSLTRLRTSAGKKSFISRLQQMQISSGAYIIPRISNPNEKGYSGPLILGGGNPEGNSIQRYSFTGDIAWMHGFNSFLNEEMLDAEINQTWRSRWPVSALDKPDKPRKKVTQNDGSMSCESYCRGVDRAPSNNELPMSWNGAQCVSTNMPDVDCDTIPGRPIECVCEQKPDCPTIQGFTNPAPSGLLSKFKW